MTLTSEQIVHLIEFAVLISGTVAAYLKTAKYTAEVLINRDKQKSVGAEAIKEINEDYDKIKQDLERLKTRDNEKDVIIATLRTDLQVLMDRIWKYITK